MAIAEQEAVSVIIPTRAVSHRSELLRRAVNSVLAQEAVRVVPLVVINGPDRDQHLTRELHADRRLQVASLEDADLPAALRAGREMVDTKWFAELDDDDVLLPGALALRVHILQAQANLDAVITNGLRRGADGDTLHIADIKMVERDPLRAMVFGHDYWLLPGSWLCRTDSVGPEFFGHMPKFRECTYLAMRLASTRQIAFLDSPTVVWHTDTPLSESKSRAYVLGEAAALQRILELDLPADVRRAVRRKVSRACHSNARLYLSEGRVKDAWAWHLKSLREVGGRRYLRYTRHLMLALLRSRPPA